MTNTTPLFTYEDVKPVLIQYRCKGCGTKFNVRGEKGRAFSVATGRAAGRFTDPMPESLTVCGAWIAPGQPGYSNPPMLAVACPACGACGGTVTAPNKRVINGREGRSACDDICAEAEGSTCNCQCGGARHGTNA